MPHDQPETNRLGLVEVRGAVTLDGNPVAGAAVIFERPDGGRSFGRTDARGAYRMMYNPQQLGVTPGPNRVQISLGGLSDAEILALAGDKEPAAASDVHLPPCYNEQSQLNVEVSASQRVLNFDLKSDCSTRGPS